MRQTEYDKLHADLLAYYWWHVGFISREHTAWNCGNDSYKSIATSKAVIWLNGDRMVYGPDSDSDNNLAPMVGSKKRQGSSRQMVTLLPGTQCLPNRSSLGPMMRQSTLTVRADNLSAHADKKPHIETDRTGHARLDIGKFSLCELALV
jgi:hypothetical protein